MKKDSGNIIVDKKVVLIADGVLVIAAILWGGEYVAMKIAVSEITPMYMNFFRFIFSSLILSIIFWGKTKNIKKEDMKAGAAIGFFMFCGFGFGTVGIQYVDAGVTAFLTSTYAVFTPILAMIIYKYKPSLQIIVGSLVCITGIALLTLDGDLRIGYGEILILISALSFAFYIIATEYYVKKRDVITVTITEGVFATAFYLVFAIIFEGKPNLSEYRAAILPMTYLVIFGTVITDLLFNSALKYTSSTHCAIIVSLEAIFAALIGVLLLNELLTIKIIFGSILVFVAILIIETEILHIPCLVGKGKDDKI